MKFENISEHELGILAEEYDEYGFDDETFEEFVERTHEGENE